MSPQFSAAVDPILLKVIALMERIEKNEVTSPQWERQSLETLFREAEGQVTDAAAWNLAKYALASWIDDLLITTPWSGHDWWESNSLEFALFKTRDRATKFFLRAKEAAELPRRDALEVYYLCVILGFRGLYKLREAEMIAGQLDLPITIGGWTKNTAAAIQLRQGRPPIRETPQSPAGAPPLESRYTAVSAAIVTVILSMLIATLWFVNNLLESPQV
ncbi:MAG: DotU family type IV/VI secretion system protein [Planctomycetota bacterium]|nr:MAG: DotU family type IV/VI secretion system protein [Planctomycetota bacterium]